MCTHTQENGEYLIENNQIWRILKLIPVEMGEYGFKEQVPKISIFKNMKIYLKEVRSGYFPFP